MRTLVRFVAGVIVEVRFEMMLFGERLWADGTREWFDAGVQSMMQCHIATIGKAFTTHGTLSGREGGRHISINRVYFIVRL